MRLLHFEADRLVLTNFTGKPTPPYAVLSHRWTDSEVLFEDVVGGKSREEVERGGKEGQQARGWHKVHFCAQKAAQHNLEYFWIDSCCIDKWNHAERHRSVNLMFKWYQNAAKCFVFLQDVQVPKAATATQQGSWEASLRSSQWFTRGWTLQELIAPACVDFYDSQGLWIGDKKTLQQLIHEVTIIPKQALDGQLNSFGYDERLRWSSNRSTTEPEDNAYCLLGILGIEMPLTYGEGKDKAMLRLAQELKVVDGAPCVLPFSRNDRYTGHEATLVDIKFKLFSDNKLDILVITGESGSGKSSLALEFCHRTRQQRQQCSVFWIDASTIDSLQQSYSEIARKLSILRDTDQIGDTIAAVYQHLQSGSSREWLLVYDNADDSSLITKISSSIPQQSTTRGQLTSNNGSIIITTTNSRVAIHLPASFIAMPKLSKESAMDVFKAHLHDSALVNQEEQAKMRQLVGLLSRPLVIVLAVAYLRVSKATIEEYVHRVQEEITARDEQDSIADRSVEVVIDLSLRHITSHNPEAAECLFLLACFTRQDIPTSLLGYSTDELIPTIELLSRYALITRRPASSAVDVHQLISGAIIRYLEKLGRSNYYRQQALQQIGKAFPSPDFYNRSQWRRYLPHARWIIENSNNENDSSYIVLKSRYGNALSLDGRWKEAEELEVQLMETSLTIGGRDHPDTLVSMANLALTYRNQGRCVEAEELEVQVLETRKTVLGQDHPDTLASITSLASTYWEQGRWKEAEELEVQALKTMKIVIGQDHPDTLTSMNNLALTYQEQGRCNEAEELQVQVTEIKKTVLGQDHPSTLISTANLALTYWKQGRWKETEELELRVMETMKIILGQDHPSTLTSMANLALTYWNNGRWNEAEELFIRAVETMKTVFGDDHPSTLTVMANLSVAYKSQNRWQEAQTLELEIKDITSRPFHLQPSNVST